MKMLAIDTSCDDTSVAVLDNEKVLSNIISSQADIHGQWGGVVPNLAKRAHVDRIDFVIKKALEKAGVGMDKIEVLAVTQGPGLSPALGVGVDKAKELAKEHKKNLVAVNHIEGHLLSVFLKDNLGQPDREIELPSLALTVSGGHSMIVMIHNFGKYEVLGKTLDDAAGEALDKAGKLMGLGYPGGPIIEKRAKSGRDNFLELPRPMKGREGFDLSFSGLKTAFYYQIKDWGQEKIEANIDDLAASFQTAVFDSLLSRFEKAVDEYGPKSIIGVGGVMNNNTLMAKLEKMATQRRLKVYFPYCKSLNGDNAAMIGMVGYYKAKKGEFVEDVDSFDRDARLEL